MSTKSSIKLSILAISMLMAITTMSNVYASDKVKVIIGNELNDVDLTSCMIDNTTISLSSSDNNKDNSSNIIKAKGKSPNGASYFFQGTINVPASKFAEGAMTCNGSDSKEYKAWYDYSSDGEYKHVFYIDDKSKMWGQPLQENTTRIYFEASSDMSKISCTINGGNKTLIQNAVQDETSAWTGELAFSQNNLTYGTQLNIKCDNNKEIIAGARPVIGVMWQ